MTRAVLDTNVLVSALTGAAVTGRIYTMLRQGKFLLVISPGLIEELSHVLARPVFGLLPADLDAILSFIRAHAEVVDPKEETITFWGRVVGGRQLRATSDQARPPRKGARQIGAAWGLPVAPVL